MLLYCVLTPSVPKRKNVQVINRVWKIIFFFNDGNMGLEVFEGKVYI